MLAALLSVAAKIARSDLVDGIAYTLGVGWHPTPRAAAVDALEWAGIGPQDVVYELGCGDGVVAAEAVRLGASAVCVERDPDLAAEAQLALQAAGPNAMVLEADLFEVDLSDATVVYMFLLPEMISRLRATTFASLPQGAQVISREFEVHGWPCGTRFRSNGSLFVRWRMPQPEHVDTDAEGGEAGAVDHQLECAADETIDEDALQEE